MFIEKRANGKYRAGMYYDDPMTGKRRKVSITIDSDTKAARKAAYDALRDKIAELSYVKKDEEITLKEISEKYTEHQKASTKAGTYRRDKIMIRKVVDTLGEDVLANKLTARYVDQKLRATGKENVGLNTYLNQFKRMMRWAYRMEYVDDIAFLDRLPAYPDPEKKLRIEEKFLSSDELKKLLEGMTVTKWKLLTQFLALSGLRIGEAMGLNDTDVTDVIVINKTFHPYDRTLSLSAKTDAGNREVFVQDELKEVIRQIRAYIRKEKIQYGHRSKLFFPGIDGEPIQYPAYNKYLRENTERIIGRPLTPHALRHTHVSLLAESGVSLDAISRRVGHEDSRITKEIYLHITEKQKQKDNEEIKQIKIL